MYKCITKVRKLVRVCRYVRLIEATEERINDGRIIEKIRGKKNEHIGKKARNHRVMKGGRTQFFPTWYVVES